MLTSALASFASLNAPLAQAVGVNIPATFLEGLLSFGSPCVLPLVPGYLSFISGVSVNRVATAEGPDLDKYTGLRWGDTRRVVAAALSFIAGFTVVFIIIFGLANVITNLLGADV